MGNIRMEDIRKVVYLDEQAVVDFLELTNKGDESIVMKKISETMGNIETEGSIGKSFFGLAKLKLTGNASHKKNNIIETQISSTLISNFIQLSKNDNYLIYIENAKLVISKDSPAYFRNLSPILQMIEDINKVKTLNSEEKNSFSGIDIKKIETTLDTLSGYYDLICYCEDGTNKILRFNIDGLRNNYTLNDLTKMNLKIVGVKVGELNELDINFSTQMDRMTGTDIVGASGIDFDDEQLENNKSNYDLIDVLFSGV